MDRHHGMSAAARGVHVGRGDGSIFRSFDNATFNVLIVAYWDDAKALRVEVARCRMLTDDEA